MRTAKATNFSKKVKENLGEPWGLENEGKKEEVEQCTECKRE